MTTVTTLRTSTKRGMELLLTLFACAIVLVAWVNVDLVLTDRLPPQLFVYGGSLVGGALVFHLVVRWRVPYADPLLLPIAILLNGLGLVMIHRLGTTRDSYDLDAITARQLLFTAIGFTFALVTLLVLSDHRMLRRYTWTAGIMGLFFLLLPLVPGIGVDKYGARIWINIAGFSFQPGEIAKLALTVFFAGYLVTNRDSLSLVGRRVLGIPLPRAKDFGPLLILWALAVGVLVLQKDLGTSLLVFGLFLAMLYVATERISWVAIGLLLFGGAAVTAYRLFPHLRERVSLLTDPFDPALSDQVRNGLMGLGHGGVFGTGLGQGYPYLNFLPRSDYIMASFGEELGLVGVFAILTLYALFVERGLRTAIGVRDGFGKLLAVGLSFTLGLQVFVIVGGILRVIPLTGLTTPFLSHGGSSLLANWIIVALLLRISDQARRPLPERLPAAPGSGGATAVPTSRRDDTPAVGKGPAKVRRS